MRKSSEKWGNTAVYIDKKITNTSAFGVALHFYLASLLSVVSEIGCTHEF